MTINLQKLGGIAAIFEGSAYIFGMIVFIFLLNPPNAESLSSQEKLEYLLASKELYQMTITAIYILFGIFLVPLVLAIYERLKVFTEPLAKLITVLGIIWSVLVIASGMISNIGIESAQNLFDKDPVQATLFWTTIDTIHIAIGGGNEIIGGLWVLLISWVGLMANIFPKMLNFIGLIVGLAGVLTTIPGLKDLGIIFGLVQIIWFIWLGIYLLQNQTKMLNLNL